MSTSLLRRGVASTFALLLLTFVLQGLGATPAVAGPYDCGCGAGYGGGTPVCNPNRWRARGYRTHGRRCDPGRAVNQCRNEYRFMARGQSWALLRMHLHRIRIEPNHFHARSYWYRRYPSRYGAGWRGNTCIGHDYPTTECPLVMAALGRPDEIPEDLRDPTPAERLGRGMERFFRGAYEDAAADFVAASEADPDDLRPLYGKLFCAVLGEKDWDGAVRHMRTLLRKQALSGADRLDLEGSFSDPDSFGRFREGLVSYTKWNFHKVNPQIVAGWSFAATGDLERARVHLKAALRFSPKNTVARALLDTLDGPTKAEDEKNAQPAPVPAPDAPSPERLPDRDPPENLARKAG